MNEEGLKKEVKQESGKPWKKCMWTRYHLSTGTQSLGEGMQGIATLMVIKGTIQFFSRPGEDPFLLRENEFCIISDIPPYKVLVQEETRLLMCLFHLEIFPFDREMLGSLLPFYQKEEREHVVLKMNEVIYSFAKLMDDFIQRGIEGDLFFELKRQELFLLLIATYPKRDLAMFLHPLIGEGVEFKGFVISNYIKAKNVQQLAKMANYSTSGFIKKFKRYFNESPYQWMLRHKAKLIYEEICTAKTTLKEIAFKYNFSTYPHFKEFCKMQFGATPSQLQRGTIKER